MASLHSNFCFGDDTQKSLGITSLSLKTPPRIPYIIIKCDVVEVGIPPLLGLDVMDKHSLLAETVTNQLIKKMVAQENGNKPFYVIDDWKVLFVSANQRVYVEMRMPHNVLYTSTQL